MIDTGLHGKVALVTGANHGVGAATARALAAQGAAVFVTFLRLPLSPDEEAADTNLPGRARYRAIQAQDASGVVGAIRRAGGRVEAWETDLADPATVPLLFDRVESALGPVDVLVNNAAYCDADTFTPPEVLGDRSRSVGDVPMSAISATSHDRHFAVNSRAPALMMAELARRHALRGARWGRVINVSTDGASGFAGVASYGAAKHALESYSRAAANELRPYGITVNVVSLGPIQTGYITPELERRLGDVAGQPEDAADVIVFLASHQARWVTGQLIYVGNGHVMPL